MFNFINYQNHLNLVIRQIPSQSKSLYLTFDDGPDPENTPAVLDLLGELNAHATFFVIGASSKKHTSLLRRILQEGHSLHSHSSDHSYRHFFCSRAHLKRWVFQSMDELKQLTGADSSAFRPPAGIITPPLLDVAEELNISLILWQHRFFDALWAIKQKEIVKKLTHLKPGDIILLHDKQRAIHRDSFRSSLQLIFKYLVETSLSLSSLTEKEIALCQKQK